MLGNLGSMVRNPESINEQTQQKTSEKERDSLESDFQKFLRENGMYEEMSSDEDDDQILKKIEGVRFEIVGDNGGKGIGD